MLDRILRHNLRNSLHAIDGHAELLQTEELDAETRQTLLEAIRQRTATMQNLAEKTTEIRAIVSAQREDLTWGALDLDALVERYQEQYPDAVFARDGSEEAEVQLPNAELFEKAMDEAVDTQSYTTIRCRPK